MFEKRLREAFREAIKKNVPPAPAIATKDRPKHLAAVVERRRELEQREEAAILSAEPLASSSTAAATRIPPSCSAPSSAKPRRRDTRSRLVAMTLVSHQGNGGA